MKCKTKINFIIDTLMVLAMTAIIGIGLLIKYTLLTGSERWETYGQNVELTLWGMDRHQWGSIHLILGFFFIGLLLLHIIFHWKVITIYYRLFIRTQRGRIAFAWAFVGICLLLLVFPFFIPFKVTPLTRGEGHQHKGQRIHSQIDKTVHITEQSAAPNDSDQPTSSDHQHHGDPDVRVYGQMTLKEVARIYLVPSDSIRFFLGIPTSISDGERLGRIKRRVQFQMSDIEQYIKLYYRRHKQSE